MAFAKDIIVDKPIPTWFFQIIDDLHEVEDSVTLSHINLRKFPSSEFLRSIHESRSTSPVVIHPVPSGP
jgi:hypothetical protein